MSTQSCVLAWLCQRLSVVGGKYVLIIHSQGQTCQSYLAAQSTLQTGERQLSFQRSHIQNAVCARSTIIDENNHNLQFICTAEWVQSAVLHVCRSLYESNTSFRASQQHMKTCFI